MSNIRSLRPSPIPFFVVALAGVVLSVPSLSCSSAVAGPATPCDAARPYGEVPNSSRDAFWVTSASCGVAQSVRGLPDQDRRRVRDAAAALVRNCPYNRSMAQLSEVVLGAMGDSFALLDDDGVTWTSPVIIDRLRHLQSGLHAHREAVAALGLSPLPTLQPGDYLYGRETWMQPAPSGDDREAVFADAGRRHREFQTLVDAYPEDVRALIEDADARLKSATDGRWPLLTELDALRVALQEIEILARHYAQREEGDERTPFRDLARACDETLDLMDDLLGGYC